MIQIIQYNGKIGSPSDTTFRSGDGDAMEEMNRNEGDRKREEIGSSSRLSFFSLSRICFEIFLLRSH